MEKNYTHNNTLKRLAGALLLDRKQIRDICALGGVTVSASLADGWRRGNNTYRSRDPGSRHPGELERRDKPMTDQQWSGFWRGLEDTGEQGLTSTSYEDPDDESQEWAEQQ